MRFLGLLLFLLYFSFGSQAQKKLPNFISNTDKRKVERAKKLLNQGKILEGEKILTDLRNENMNEGYFHEALVQIQMQILNKIALQKPPSEDEGEYFLDGSEILKASISLAENFVDNGLARTVEEKKETVDNIRLARSDKKKLKNAIRTAENTSKDSVENPIEAAKKEIDKLNAAEAKVDKEKKEKLVDDKRKAKKEKDITLISYESYAYQLNNNSRLATLKHERVDSASHYLRVLNVDTLKYDTLLAQIDLDLFADAIDYYYTRDYTRAAKRLKALTEKHADYLPAHLYLANSYYNLGLDTPTYKEFVYIAQNFSERPEGLEGLSRYYLAKGKYQQAAASIIKAITIYPEDAYFAHLDRVLKRMGKKFKSHWVRRGVYPLKTDKNYEEIIAKEKSPWRYYQNAKSMVYSYAKKGVLRSNEITKERYLELYAWREMLAGNLKIDSLIKDPKKRAEYLRKNNLNEKKKKKENKINFPFARSMEKMGFLDCYVFISLFHHDLYDGFKDFVAANPDKIEKYFYILLNWENKKFDKFRISEEKPKDEVKTKRKSKKKK